MANHVLSLEIPTVSNPCVLKIFDTSVYSPLVSVFNPRLEIPIAWFEMPVLFDDKAWFPTATLALPVVFNSKDL